MTRLLLFTLVLASETAAGKPEALPVTVPLQALDGSSVTLARYAGKPLLVELWATWCDACAESLAVAERLERDLGPRGLAVVSVSLDVKPDDVSRYLATHPHPATVLRDGSGALADALGLHQLPATLVVDADGAIHGSHEGKVRNLAEHLREELEAVITARP